MRNRPQILETVAFLLQRIVRCGSSLDLDFICLDLEGLLRLRSSYQCTGHDNGCSYI